MTTTQPDADALDPYVPGRGNPGYEVTSYDLELDYSIPSNRLEGRAVITARALDALPRFALDLAGLRALRVMVDGTPARQNQRGSKLYVTPSRALVGGATFTIEVRYSGNPRPVRSTWGMVGWEELTDGVLVAGQPSGAPTWFPCNDRARQKAPFRIQVTVASTHLAVANGALVSKQTRGSKTTWVYRQAEPTSPYLMTIHIGRYERRELPGAPIPLWTVAPPARQWQVETALVRQSAMIATFVDLFGPYPFEAGYTVVVTPDPLELPLEAQGQAVFGSNHLYGTFERWFAHELAHQWFGNSVTASSWRDIWLHEGFACYAEWLWSEASGGLSANAHAAAHHARLETLPTDLVLADPGAADMFDDRVYKRGALTLHALRLELGDTAFFGMLRTWASTHRHGTVSTDDLIALAEQVAGRSLHLLFDAWLRYRPLPALKRR